MNRSLSILAIALISFAWTLPAQAQRKPAGAGGGAGAGAGAGAGQTPPLRLKTVDGRIVGPETFPGRILIVDFWATWCGPCMAEAPHMVQINQQYGPKGVQIIGVSLDDAAQKMTQVAQAKGFAWPLCMDNANNNISKAMGVTGIPHCFMFGPDGNVIWKGHPSGLDGAIEDALKTNPPKLVDPKVLAEATAACEKIEAALAANDFETAMKLMVKVPPLAMADARLNEKASAIVQQIEQHVKDVLSEVSTLIANKDYGKAGAQLRSLIKSLGNSPLAAKPKQTLSELMKQPEARAAMQGAEKGDRAAEALEAAQKLKEDGKAAAAYTRFKSIVKEFAGTPAAETAAEEVAAYEKDKPATAKEPTTTTEPAPAKAKTLISLAQAYARNGAPDKAREKYQEVIDQFPNTESAKQAAEAIEQLPK